MKEKDYLDQAIIVTDENRGEIAKGTPPFFRVILEAASRLQTGVMILALPDGRILKYDSGETDPVTGIIHVHDWAMGRRTALGARWAFTRPMPMANGRPPTSPTPCGCCPIMFQP